MSLTIEKRKALDTSFNENGFLLNHREHSLRPIGGAYASVSSQTNDFYILLCALDVLCGEIFR